MDLQSKPQILIVDDLPENLEVLSGIFEHEYSILIAKTGETALNIVRSNPGLAVILLDIMMPEMDGYEVCRRLKADPGTAKIPVIFISAKTEIFDEAMGFEVGGVDYLTKPVTPLIARARIQAHIQIQATRRELEKQNEILQENVALRETINQITCHDLKSPLTVFLNAPCILKQEENLSPDQLEYLDIIEKAATKMLEMINRTLDLYKMERGQYNFNPLPIDVRRVFTTVFGSLQGLASEKNITCLLLENGHSCPESKDYFIPGEEYLFFSVFSNLVKNAIEASPPAEKVVVELEFSDASLIRVKNKGTIPEQIRDRFFGRYATFGKKDGTGLGAYSAKLITQTLGGSIQATSSESTGTILTLSFPH